MIVVSHYKISCNFVWILKKISLKVAYDDDAVSVGDGNVVGVRHNAGDGNGD